LKAKHLVAFAADRSFYRHDTHRRKNPPALASFDSCFYFFKGEGGFARRKRNQVESAQCLHTVARIVVDMTFGLDDGALFFTCKLPDRNLVCKGSRGHEHSAFFS